MGNLTKGRNFCDKMLELAIGIVGIAVAIISIVVTIIDIAVTLANLKRQKSNRHPDQG